MRNSCPSFVVNAFAAAVLLAVPAIAAAQDPHADMHHRGAAVMGFDQEKTVHRFSLYMDGGAIEVSVKDAAYDADLRAMRSHLPHIAAMFGEGNFAAPMLVHDTKAVPGTAELTRLRSKITYTYVEMPTGGRVDIVTADPSAVAAVHAFLAFQIADHKTGDSLAVKRR